MSYKGVRGWWITLALGRKDQTVETLHQILSKMLVVFPGSLYRGMHQNNQYIANHNIKNTPFISRNYLLCFSKLVAVMTASHRRNTIWLYTQKVSN